MRWTIATAALLCLAAEQRDPDSLANQRPPSAWQLAKQERLERVKAMKIAKAMKEHAARQYRLRARQSAQSRYVQQRYQYDRAMMPTMAELSRQRFAGQQAYQRAYSLGLVRPPSCTRGRR